MRQRLLPPVQLVVRRDGTETTVVVNGLTDGDRVADLAAAVGLSASDRLIIDGQIVGSRQRLAAADVRRGSVIEAFGEPVIEGPGDLSDTGAAAHAESEALTIEWYAGPDSGRRVGLGIGRHIVGRQLGSRQPGGRQGDGRRIDESLAASDRRLATHHGLVVVRSGHGSLTPEVTYQDLAGVASSLDGAPIDGSVALGFGQVLRVGSSLLRIRGPVVAARRAPSTRPTGTWTQSLNRPPRRLPPTRVSTVELPEIVGSPLGDAVGPGAMALVTAGFSLLGGLVMMLVFRQELMAIMALVGAVTAVATWSVQSIRSRRSRRRSRQAAVARTAEIEARLSIGRLTEARRLAELPGLAEAGMTAESGVGLWERRLTHPDALEVILGVGSCQWSPTPVGTNSGRPLTDDDALMAAGGLAPLTHVGITIQLCAGRALGIVGSSAMRGSLARSLVTQLAVAHGPADLQVVVVTGRDGAGDWDWLSWLPHSQGDDGGVTCGPSSFIDEWAAAQLAATADPAATVKPSVNAVQYAGGERVSLVVVDDPATLASRTSPLRRLLGAETHPVVLIVVAAELRDLPALCGEAIEIADDATAIRHCWATSDGSQPLGAPAERFRISGATPATAAVAARRMARFDDPERVNTLGSLPAAVTLDQLLGDRVANADTIAEGWLAAGPDPSPRALIGVAADGTVELDLRRDGPHALIGGTTGAGKSELLRTLVAALAVASPPDLLSFVLIDYKGGAAFDACARLPHVVGIVTDLDDRLASRVLVSLDAELRRREHLLRDAGASDLTAYRAVNDRPAIPRLVVVVDEFAALATELPEFLGSLVAIAQRGRSLGVHMVLATQRPSGVISDDIRANTNLRIALRVQDRADAMDVVGDPIAASLSRNRPGSAVVRLDATELAVFQTARCTGEPGPDGATPSATALDVLVERLVQATALRGAGPARRPWLDPLPASIAPDEQSAGEPGTGEPGTAFGVGSGVDFGVVDVPETQSRDRLQWNVATGHLLLAGSIGSGTTTALVTVATHLAASCAPSELHLYVIDAVGCGLLDGLGGLGHCAGVIGSAEPERRSRLLQRLSHEISRRQASTAGGSENATTAVPLATIVVAIDGLGSLRSALDTAAGQGDADRLAMIMQEGPRVGVVVAATVDRPTEVPSAVMARASSRWVFGLTDPMEAAFWGVNARSTIPLGQPGRCLQVESGHEAQLFRDRRSVVEIVDAINRAAAPCVGPMPLASLPTTVAFTDLIDGHDDARDIDAHGFNPHADIEGSVYFRLGLGVASVATAGVVLHDGEHLLVAGPARSGRSTTLTTMVEAWRGIYPDGWVGTVRPRRNAALANCDATIDGSLRDVVSEATLHPDQPRLIVVDDAELVDDDGGLQALLATAPAGLHVIAAGRPEALRAAYGHWTGVVKRARKGVLLGAIHDLDADVLGVMLPRHRPAHAPIGRGYLVADGQVEAVQLAMPSVRRLLQVA